MNLDKIGYNIKFLREQCQWSQQELADKLLISRSAVAKWESNLGHPDITYLIRLSDVFDVSIDHLLGTHSYHDGLLKEFKRIYSSKTKTFDEEVIELIEYLMHHPNFKDQIYRLKKLSHKKQLSIHKLFSDLIDQYEQL